MVAVIGKAEKDPVEILPYTIDWRQKWFEDPSVPVGIVIASSVWNIVVGAGLTKGDGTNGAPAPSFTDDLSTVWFLGGTIGVVYLIENLITTSPAPPMTGKRTIALEIIVR